MVEIVELVSLNLDKDAEPNEQHHTDLASSPGPASLHHQVQGQRDHWNIQTLKF